MADMSEDHFAEVLLVHDESKPIGSDERQKAPNAVNAKAESRDENESTLESISADEREGHVADRKHVSKTSLSKPLPSRKNKAPKSPQRTYMHDNSYPPSYPGAQRGLYPPPHGMHGRPPAPGPFGPAGPYYGGPHDFRGPHPMYHQMPPLPHPGQFNGGYVHAPNMTGRPGPYHPSYGGHSYPSGHPPMGYHPAGPHHHPGGFAPPMNTSHSMDNNSISSSKSKGSRGSKKRTIDDAKDKSHAYSFRRTNSNASSNTTVTHVNMDIHPLKQDHGGRKTYSGSDNIFEQDHVSHRRQHSGGSTTSSLSAGGFSLHSYEGPRSGAVIKDRPTLAKASPKRRKGAESAQLIVQTGFGAAYNDDRRQLSPTDSAIDGPESSRFQKLSMNDEGKPRNENNGSSLFMALSTSPINHPEVDATPLSKNLKPQGTTTITIKTDVMEDDDSKDHKYEKIPSPFRKTLPTPTGSGEMSDMTDEQLLNRHMRGQTFTPLPHLDQNGISPSNAAFSTIHQGLSWSIAGDTPSLEDLAACSWEEHEKNESKRPGSTTSQLSSSTRDIVISPHNFSLWKEEHEHKKHGEESKDHDSVRLSMLSPHSEMGMAIEGESGTTTPLPLFFSDRPNSEERENVKKHDHYNGIYGSRGSAIKHYPNPHYGGPPTPVFAGSKPPTPLFSGSNHGFSRSPMHGDSRMMFGHPHAHDRVRNLRGRVPGHMAPMPLHIPPPMSSHHPLTSPIGLGQHGKPMWSPHHGIPSMASPHGMGSPMGLTQSKRKCMPLKPPIPSKFQGDIDKMTGAVVPEFTSLVNFPAHMSQKQSVNLPEGMRCCVMCGQACPCSNVCKNKKVGKGKSDLGRNGDIMGDKEYAIIPTQNKGLCTTCDVNVWVVCQSGLEIKWCKGCKNFRPWAAFGDKGLATKCLRCRERQREKYALQKDEKEKVRLNKGTKIKV